MNQTQATALNRLNSLSEDAQRSLKSLRHDISVVLGEIEEGTRFASASNIGRTAARTTELLAKVEVLLEMTNALGVEPEDLLAAYQGKATYYMPSEG